MVGLLLEGWGVYEKMVTTFLLLVTLNFDWSVMLSRDAVQKKKITHSWLLIFSMPKLLFEPQNIFHAPYFWLPSAGNK